MGDELRDPRTFRVRQPDTGYAPIPPGGGVTHITDDEILQRLVDGEGVPREQREAAEQLIPPGETVTGLAARSVEWLLEQGYIAEAGTLRDPHYIEPKAAVLVEEHELDHTVLTGTGEDGLITEADVVAAIEQPDQDESGEDPDPGTEPIPDATAEAVELAEDHGIDLTTITGTGHNGRILIGDVRDEIDFRELEALEEQELAELDDIEREEDSEWPS